MIEAKYSVNVKANLRGFDVQVTIRTDDGDIFAMFKDTMDKLEALGAVPERRWENNRKGEGAPKGTKGSNAQVSKEPEPKPEPETECPVHHKARESTYGGYFCPVKLPDGSYCQWKSQPESEDQLPY
jgi:hypothetical protein